MKQTLHIAQLNIARMLAPATSPIMADFVNNLDRINAIADVHEGFVWRMQGDALNAHALQVFEDEFLIVNLSVWTSMQSLFKFTYESGHIEIMKRKKEWFSNITGMHMVFWYTPIGHEPSPEEAKERLEFLNTNGETPYAFTFKSKFTSEDALNYKR